MFLKIFLRSSLLFFVCFFPFFGTSAEDGSVMITPVVMDLKAYPREHLKKTIILTNEKNYKVNLYSLVNNISSVAGVQPFSAASVTDLPTSLVNWINFPRGVVELGIGENKRIDFEIEISPRAAPGVYHALVAFGEGATREEAQSDGRKFGLTINLEILDKVKERLEIRKFVPDKIIFRVIPATFSFSLANVGDKSLHPEGELRIYARSGAEIGTVTLDALKDIAPGDVYQSSVSFKNLKHYGRYKGILIFNYGEEKTIQDIIFFWFMPVRFMAVIFGGIMGLGTLITTLAYSRYGQKKKA